VIKRVLSGLLAAGLLSIAQATAQQTPANIDDAVTQFTDICMADQTQYFDSYDQAKTSCACSVGMAGGYFNHEDFISYVVMLEEILNYDDLSQREQYDSYVAALRAKGFDDAKLADLMDAAAVLGDIEETFCGAFW